jgi:hypothetical protein
VSPGWKDVTAYRKPGVPEDIASWLWPKLNCGWRHDIKMIYQE